MAGIGSLGELGMMMVAGRDLKGASMIAPQLTERQAAVRELIARGLTAKEIAAQLGISHRTVEVHREEIYRKMGVRGAIEMVRKMFLPEGDVSK